MDVSGGIDLEGQVAELRGQSTAHGRLECRRVAENAALLGLAGGEKHGLLAGHFPTGFSG